jgi:glutaminyl-tRNA synthetase
MTTDLKIKGKDFIRQIIHSDLANGKNDGKVCTRFPPEPNGFLHIGHALSICLNFGIAEEFDGQCYLRFDDTNPAKENEDFVTAIKENVAWLGFDWDGRLTHASDYFDDFYDYALQLIENGQAFVDSQNAVEIRKARGTLNIPGSNSPYRDRSVAENAGLFERMKNGEFENGEHVLRAKIDMTAPNINLRDPVIFRILHLKHQRTGQDWCIYPMYDFAHTLSDAIEGITHSLCTLEFEDHRPFYEWFLDHLTVPHRPRQIEFSRLNIEHTITSKRKLATLVEDNTVSGWDDPRMPTLSGMRKRGYPAVAIKTFCNKVGVTKKDKSIQMALLESCVREQLDEDSPRVMAVINPLKVVIENYPEDKTESLEAPNHPKQPEMGTRNMLFSKELFIEHDDFMEDPPSKFFRLQPGGEVRLRFAYIIKCNKIIKDSSGVIKEIHCSYDPNTKSGSTTSNKKVKGTIHWVSAKNSINATINLYENLYSDPHPESSSDLNKNSLTVIENAIIEDSFSKAKPGDRFQFERTGYFVINECGKDDDTMSFNRIVTLRDTWSKITKT